MVQGGGARVVRGVQVDAGQRQLVDGRHCPGVVELRGMVRDYDMQERPRMRIADRHVTSALGQLSYLRRERCLFFQLRDCHIDA